MGWEKGGSGSSSGGSVTLIQSFGPLTSPQTTFDFSAFGIPKAIKISGQVRSDKAAVTDNVLMRFNGDTGANYQEELLQASNATVTAARSVGNVSANWIIPANSEAAIAGGEFEIWIPNPVGTTWPKMAIVTAPHLTDTATSLEVFRQAWWWRKTPFAAITDISLSVAPSNFIAGSWCAAWAYS